MQVVNRKALHQYEVLERYVAGLVLEGAEVKSLRAGGGQIQDAFCVFREGELYVANMYIAPYERAGYAQPPARRMRKLLLRAEELRRLRGKLTQKGLTLVPLRLFFNERGWAKLEIALVRGKAQYDRRRSIQEREEKRRLERLRKRF
ncbi:MAG: SsrA-binding protein SmpB [Bacteroidia bacterium]|nr:SsrA-binding protein SmpB [Bacteroidia bacterium]